VAAKAGWGPGNDNKEPVSGVNGDVSKGEPYDAGNLEPEEQQKVESRLNGKDDNRNSIDKTAANAPSGDTTSGQNDTRHPDEVSADELKVDVTGPGPKPIDAVAREHGGDAGRDKEETTAPSGDAPKEGEDDAKEKGTGEQYVKTSGLAADGGDFDATKPGAGREADRLLDQKGVQRDDHVSPTQSADTSGGANDSPSSKSSRKSSRRSLGDRIKAKLHKR